MSLNIGTPGPIADHALEDASMKTFKPIMMDQEVAATVATPPATAMPQEVASAAAPVSALAVGKGADTAHPAEKPGGPKPKIIKEKKPAPGQVPQQEKDLPESVKHAVEEIRKYRLSGKGNLWAEAQAVLHLFEACEMDTLPYQKVAEKFLSNEGGSFSSGRISMLLHAARYLKSKSIAIPEDVAGFPSIYHVAPMTRFLDRPKVAEKKKAAWEKLHDQVFGPPENRPSVDEVRKQVGRLFAPPGPRQEPDKKPPTMREVKREGLEAWFGEVAPKGSFVVVEVPVAVAVPSAQVIAAALTANWKSVSKANLIKIVKAK
jgi:hypothetical protein